MTAKPGDRVRVVFEGVYHEQDDWHIRSIQLDDGRWIDLDDTDEVGRAMTREEKVRTEELMSEFDLGHQVARNAERMCADPVAEPEHSGD